MSAPRNDGIVAMVGLVSVAFSLVALEAADNETVGVPLLIGGLVTMAAAYASGGIGYYRVKRCRRAVEDFNRRAMPAGTNATVPGLGVSGG